MWPAFASQRRQLYPRRKAEAGTSAARAAISPVPRKLCLAEAADRAKAEGMAQPSREVAEQSE